MPSSPSDANSSSLGNPTPGTMKSRCKSISQDTREPRSPRHRRSDSSINAHTDVHANANTSSPATDRSSVSAETFDSPANTEISRASRNIEPHSLPMRPQVYEQPEAQMKTQPQSQHQTSYDGGDRKALKTGVGTDPKMNLDSKHESREKEKEEELVPPKVSVAPTTSPSLLHQQLQQQRLQRQQQSQTRQLNPVNKSYTSYPRPPTTPSSVHASLSITNTSILPPPAPSSPAETNMKMRTKPEKPETWQTYHTEFVRNIHAKHEDISSAVILFQIEFPEFMPDTYLCFDDGAGDGEDLVQRVNTRMAQVHKENRKWERKLEGWIRELYHSFDTGDMQ